MREIKLDASRWRTKDDLYDSLLGALGAPAWHGRNLDALHDSIRSNNMNIVQVPFVVRLVGTANLPTELRSYLRQVVEVMEGFEVDVIAEPPLQAKR